MTKEELESVYKESEKVERSKYGFHIFKEGNEYTVNHPLNKTTRKGETFKSTKRDVRKATGWLKVYSCLMY